MNRFPWKLALGAGVVGTVVYVAWKRSQPSTAAAAAPAVAPSSSATPFAAAPSGAPAAHALYGVNSDEATMTSSPFPRGYAVGKKDGVDAYFLAKDSPSATPEDFKHNDPAQSQLWRLGYDAGFRDGYYSVSPAYGGTGVRP